VKNFEGDGEGGRRRYSNRRMLEWEGYLNGADVLAATDDDILAPVLCSDREEP
jgi:hypothetical protein